MARITGSIPSLFNGVSQQTPALRLPTQGSEQVNMFPSLVQGLVKRPPLEVINDSISDEYISPRGTMHLVDRGGDNGGRERCLIYITPKGITAFRPDGTEKPVTYSEGARNYLGWGNCSRFAVLTLADYTFIANPLFTVGMSEVYADEGASGVVFVLKQAAYDTDYSISFGIKNKATGLSAGRAEAKVHTWTSVGTTEEPKDKISIKAIASMLKTKLMCTSTEEDGSFPFNNLADAEKNYPLKSGLNFTVNITGGTILIEPDQGYEIVVPLASDSEGNQLIHTVYREVARFSDLPDKAPEGYIVNITGDDTTRFNDYFVKYQDGSWHECPAPKILTTLNPYTMPHVLIDHGSSFEFTAYLDWAKRKVGDDYTCPIPDFVTHPITGLFQYRNRLGFLSEDVISMSEASEFFNFWNTTAMTTVDSDPISLSASVEGAPTLKWAVPFNEEVILFSDRAQFRLTAPEVLSPSTAAVYVATTYALNADIKPLSNGRNIFFTDAQANTALASSTRVYEYYLDSDTGSKAAMEVTSHVPEYISKDITDMACSPGLNLLVLYSQGSNVMWMYKYYWSGDQKLQAAWFKATFGSRGILGAEFIGDNLYCLVTSQGRYFLCKMDFSKTLEETSDPLITEETNGVKPFPVYLDMLNTYTGETAYDENENVTYLSFPSYYDRNKLVIVNMDTYRELEIPRFDEVSNRLCVHGKLTGRLNFKIGERYDSTYTFSQALVRASGGADGQGQVASHSGRLQLQQWRLVLGPTGYLEAQVLHEDGRTFSYPVTSLGASMPRHTLGRVNTNEISYFAFPVRGDAKTITVRLSNPTWFPSTVISAEWDANFITKGRQHL